MNRTEAPEPTGFTGFGGHLVDVFDDLAANNERDWFKANKQQYDTQVAGLMRDLATLLEPEFGTIKMYRPYRDVRFSTDKRPIQEHASVSANDDRGYGYDLQVSAEGLLLTGGFYQPSRERLDRFRTMLDDPGQADHVRQRLDEACRVGFQLSDDGLVKGVPRGYSRDHPEIDLLRHTQLALTTSYPPVEWLSEPACYDWLSDAGI